MSRFMVVSEDVIDTLQLDAGVLLSNFDPANPVRPQSADIIATTSGGIKVTCKPTYSNILDDVDNLMNNSIEGKHLDSYDCSLSFTSLKFNAENTRFSVGAADVTSETGYRKITPRRNLQRSDFADNLWWVGDKANGGAFAVCLKNALSTDGLNMQTTKNGKGTNAVTITGHVSLAAQDVVPMELYDIDPPNTKLSALSVGSLTLTPTFSANTTEYAATTTNASDTVTATAADNAATVVIKKGSSSVTSGSAVTWGAGANVVTVTVTNDTATKTYTITVTKTTEG